MQRLPALLTFAVLTAASATLSGCDTARDHVRLSPGVYVSDGGGVVRLDSAGRRERVVKQGHSPAISPALGKMLYERNGNTTAGGYLRLYDFATGRDRALGEVFGVEEHRDFGRNVLGGDPRWAPDGRLSYYNCAQCEIAGISFLVVSELDGTGATGFPSATAEHPDRHYSDHAWSPGGAYLAVLYSVGRGAAQRSQVELRSGSTLAPVRSLWYDASVAAIAWGSDEALYRLEDGRDLVRSTAEGVEVRRWRLAEGVGVGVSPPLVVGPRDVLVGSYVIDANGSARRSLERVRLADGRRDVLISGEGPRSAAAVWE